MTTLRAFHVPATRPRPYSHDWEEDWTDVLLSGGGVRGSGMSGEGEGFSLDKSFADIVYYSLKQAPLFSIIPKA